MQHRSSGSSFAIAFTVGTSLSCSSKGEPKATSVETPAPSAPASTQPVEPEPAAPAESEPAAAKPEPEAPPEPEGIAFYKGVLLPYDSDLAQIEALWPGTKARHEDGMPEITLVEDAKGNLLLYKHDEEMGVCLAGPGMATTDGFTVGEPLHALPHTSRMRCQLTVDDELLHLGDPCPGYYSGTKLVCEAADTDTFYHRLFFDLDKKHAERSGEWVQLDQALEFRDAKLSAVLEGYGGGGEDGIFMPPPPPADRPAAAPKGPPKVLARSKAGDVELTTHVRATKAAIEAALPGFKARQRAHGGYNVHKGKTRVIQFYMRVDGDPIDAIVLVGPGLVDPKGIEVGMKWKDIASLGTLSCEGEVGEDISEVDCALEGGPRYIFDHPTLLERDWGPLTLKRARTIVKGKPITSIVVRG